LIKAINFNPGTTTWIVVPPTPGTWWIIDKPFGSAFDATDVLSAQKFSDFDQFFTGDPKTRSTNFNMFRVGALAGEIVPTSNYLEYGGLITVTKARLSISYERKSTSSGVNFSLTGLESMNQTGANQYNAPFIEGAYAVATEQEAKFEFSPVYDNLVDIAASVPDGQFGGVKGDIIGMGSFDSIIIRVDSPEGSKNNCALRIWQSIEYRTNANSGYTAFASQSAMHDPMAMALYREISAMLPVAVSYYNNAGFWEWILNAVKSVSSALSFIPGPVGMIASGVNGVANMIGGSNSK
jgi:hypothetical protein